MHSYAQYRSKEECKAKFGWFSASTTPRHKIRPIGQTSSFIIWRTIDTAIVSSVLTKVIMSCGLLTHSSSITIKNVTTPNVMPAAMRTYSDNVSPPYINVLNLANSTDVLLSRYRVIYYDLWNKYISHRVHRMVSRILIQSWAHSPSNSDQIRPHFGISTAPTIFKRATYPLQCITVHASVLTDSGTHSETRFHLLEREEEHDHGVSHSTHGNDWSNRLDINRRQCNRNHRPCFRVHFRAQNPSISPYL